MIELENLAMALAGEDGDGWLSLSDNERNGWRVRAGEVAALRDTWLRVPGTDAIYDEIDKAVFIDGDVHGPVLDGKYEAAERIRALLTETT